MTITRKLYLVCTFVVFGGVINYIMADDVNNIEKSTRVQFLMIDKDTKDSVFAPYASFPEKATGVDVPGIQDEIYWYAKHLLRKCPSKEFIKDNTVCISHEEFVKRGINADVAFLRLSDGTNDVMLVVAGGMMGKVYIYECPIKTELNSSKLIEHLVMKDEVIAQQGDAIAAMRSAAGVAMLYGGGLPARPPAKDHWFERTHKNYQATTAAESRPSTMPSTRRSR